MKPSVTFLLIAVCTHAILVDVIHCHLITVEPGNEDCFHEKLKSGTKIRFAFQVLDGGNLDTDLYIKDPNNQLIHSETKQTSGHYTIEANQEGQHTYCFSNKMSSYASKIIMFNVEFTEAKSESSQESDRLQNMVTELTSLTTGVKHEMDFLAARDRLHRHLSELTNSRVSMWSIFEVLLCLIVGMGQVYYIKRFFETRRKV